MIKKITAYSQRADKNYQNRYNLIRNLAWSWINQFRPDVANQIKIEAEKVCPKPSKNIVPLPESLQHLK